VVHNKERAADRLGLQLQPGKPPRGGRLRVRVRGNPQANRRSKGGKVDLEGKGATQEQAGQRNLDHEGAGPPQHYPAL
jgi:hypothetical protein